MWESCGLMPILGPKRASGAPERASKPPKRASLPQKEPPQRQHEHPEHQNEHLWPKRSVFRPSRAPKTRVWAKQQASTSLPRRPTSRAGGSFRPPRTGLRVPSAESSREGGLQVVVAEVRILLEAATQELLDLLAVDEARPRGIVAAGAPQGRQLLLLRLGHQRDAAPRPPKQAHDPRELVLLVPAVQGPVCRRCPLQQLAADCSQAMCWSFFSTVREPRVDVEAAEHPTHLPNPRNIQEVQTPKRHDALLLLWLGRVATLAATLGGLAHGRLWRCKEGTTESRLAGRGGGPLGSSLAQRGNMCSHEPDMSSHECGMSLGCILRGRACGLAATLRDLTHTHTHTHTGNVLTSSRSRPALPAGGNSPT